MNVDRGTQVERLETFTVNDQLMEERDQAVMHLKETEERLEEQYEEAVSKHESDKIKLFEEIEETSRLI